METKPFVEMPELYKLRRAVDAASVKWWLFPNFKWPAELEGLRPEMEALLNQIGLLNQKLEPLGLGVALDPYAINQGDLIVYHPMEPDYT